MNQLIGALRPIASLSVSWSRLFTISCHSLTCTLRGCEHLAPIWDLLSMMEAEIDHDR